MSIAQIRKSIVTGDTQLAIEQTQNLLGNSSRGNQKVSRELFSLNTRWNQVISEFRRGVIEPESRTLEINRINDALLSLLDELEQLPYFVSFP